MNRHTYLFSARIFLRPFFLSRPFSCCEGSIAKKRNNNIVFPFIELFGVRPRKTIKGDGVKEARDDKAKNKKRVQRDEAKRDEVLCNEARGVECKGGEARPDEIPCDEAKGVECEGDEPKDNVCFKGIIIAIIMTIIIVEVEEAKDNASSSSA